jgi:hypothetical protein
MTRGAIDNDTIAHLETGEPADLPAITNCVSSFQTRPECGLRFVGDQAPTESNTVALADTTANVLCDAIRGVGHV